MAVFRVAKGLSPSALAAKLGMTRAQIVDDERAAGKASIARQPLAPSARTNAANAKGSEPRTINPPGNVTLNPADSAASASNLTCANRARPGSAEVTSAAAPARPKCFFTQPANVGYFRPSRRAHAAIGRAARLVVAQHLGDHRLGRSCERPVLDHS